MMAHSKRPRLLFQELVGKMPNSASPTRWWSDFMIIQELFLEWKHVRKVVRAVSEEKLCPAYSAACRAAMQNPKLRIEMAVVIDAARRLCASGYILEGDDMLVTKAYDIHLETQTHIEAFAHPLLDVEAHGDVDLIQYGVSCVQPMFDYLTSRFAQAPELKNMVELFEAAQIFNPSKIGALRLQRGVIQASLKKFKFISAAEHTRLLVELPDYVVAANGYDPSRTADHAKFWREMMVSLPTWSDIAFRAALLQPSSACVERIFSMLNATNHDTQENMLEDYVEGALMKRYNNLQRLKIGSD